jgi:hypothetical protein
MLSLNKIPAAYALSVSIDPYQQPRLPVEITGPCASLFNGGRQIILSPVSVDCTASVSTAMAKFSGTVSLIVTRRTVSTLSISTTQKRRTIRRRYIKNYSKTDPKVTFSFLLRSSSANMRYTIRAYTTAVTSNEGQCDTAFNEFTKESLLIRSCTKDSDCGQPLVGTSCGCTRDHVARKNASLSSFYETLARAANLNCLDALPITSPCDCPAVSGSYCNAGICDWKYTSLQ